ncbi:antibiotic biosynthesis monooxygenase [Maribacter polysiphoniae]|uniref:Antibiotic biosynthesis monooxygenase n=1 Tax=Maribacter polysiphoniae TaxID=429344 RepID=A0A316DW66_9FLAO|nr:putative quinol monooxygenase [Maribacter polysiphoniae]MBD1262159.1 antibiotic biosynthesis monooxygenase [Maribacter polysiphoniae]PWK21582.1 quinol monooxygenase YgiN [Maribacter polysiphoniae]|tara:strand:+ start:214 stop:501 length:288 start_codon:yes stop_codon:yes gene_type:complete
MIKVVAKNFAKENKIDKILELAKELVEKTVKEVGCVKYEMYQNTNEPTELVMLEEWETEEDLNKHMSTEHFKRIVPQMAEYLRKKAEINIYKKVI